MREERRAARFGNEHRVALLVLGLLTLFRLVYGANLGMAQDEMYYWQWSRHPELSYYDQGPGIAYCIKLGTSLLGVTPVGVRLTNILIGAGTGWLTYLTVWRWAGRPAALWTLLLILVAPLLAAGGVLATYDGPQVFFWAAALYALTRTLQEDRVGGWYVVGVLVGLGLLCKLTMLLFAPSVLLLLLLVPRYRRWLATPHPWLAFAIALVFFLPVLIWNATHGWMGFLHTVTLGSRRRGAAPLRWFGDFLGGQAIALGPLLFLAELYAVGRLARRLVAWLRSGTESEPIWGLSADAARFLTAFSAPTLALCLLVSLKSKMEINWPAPTHLMGLACVAVWFAHAWANGKRSARGWVAASVALSVLLTLLAFFPALPTYFGARLSAKATQKLNETYGWTPIMEYVQRARTTLEREGKPVFVSGINYRSNSALAFGLPDHPQPQALYLNSRRDQYFLWTDPTKLVGQNAVFCLDDENADAVALARRYFVSVEELPPVVVERPGFIGPVKKWYVYLCHDFKGYDPTAHVAGY